MDKEMGNIKEKLRNMENKFKEILKIRIERRKKRVYISKIIEENFINDEISEFYLSGFI